MNEKLNRVKRSMIRHSTTNSIGSQSQSSLLTVGYKASVSDTLDTECSFDISSENESFKHLLRFYSKINRTVYKLNKACVEVIQKENSIKDKTFEVKKILPKTEESEAEQSVRLISMQKYVDDLEEEVQEKEKALKTLEKRNRFDEEANEKFKLELKNMNKKNEGMQNVGRQLLKLSNLKAKLKSEFEVLNKGKVKIRDEYLRLQNRTSIVGPLKNEIQGLRDRNKGKEKEIVEIWNAIEEKKCKNQNIVDDIDRIEFKNQELFEELRELDEIFSEKKHGMTVRKQWFDEYTIKLNSKEALNRVMRIKIADNDFRLKDYREKLDAIEMDLNRKEAEFEARENELLRFEDALKQKISILLATKKR
jgi:chromosome segregation ATPase